MINSFVNLTTTLLSTTCGLNKHRVYKMCYKYIHFDDDQDRIAFAGMYNFLNKIVMGSRL